MYDAIVIPAKYGTNVPTDNFQHVFISWVIIILEMTLLFGGCNCSYNMSKAKCITTIQLWNMNM